ncbi:hypothetical protein J6590_040757 [Homalodisca vitripennis]|nr:hypothetical protein J6590_040757 [Homalodisca vitripennis]
MSSTNWTPMYPFVRNSFLQFGILQSSNWSTINISDFQCPNLSASKFFKGVLFKHNFVSRKFRRYRESLGKISGKDDWTKWGKDGIGSAREGGRPLCPPVTAGGCRQRFSPSRPRAPPAERFPSDPRCCDTAAIVPNISPFRECLLCFAEMFHPFSFSLGARFNH